MIKMIHKNERETKTTKEGKEAVIKEEIDNHDKNSYCFIFPQPQIWGSGKGRAVGREGGDLV